MSRKNETDEGKGVSAGVPAVDKRAYHRPRLVSCGLIHELTRAGSGFAIENSKGKEGYRI